MKPLDYMTLFALFVGPALAVGIQLWFTKRTEWRQRKLQILDTLMSYRGRIVHSDNIRALNTIDLVYYECEHVRQKFATLIAFLGSAEMTADTLSLETITRLEDIYTELLSEMSRVLKFDFDHTLIKTRVYRPRVFADDEQYTREVRAALLPVLRGETGIRVNTQ